MSEYIEKEAAATIPVLPKEHRKYQTMNLDDAYENGWYDALECVEKIPPADVWPVLRCRDCFANGSCIVQDALFDNDLDKAANFYCAFGRTGEDGEVY